MYDEWMLGARLGPQSGAVGCAEVWFLTEEEVMGRGSERERGEGDNIELQQTTVEGL